MVSYLLGIPNSASNHGDGSQKPERTNVQSKSQPCNFSWTNWQNIAVATGSEAIEGQMWNYTKHLRQKRLSKESRMASIVLSRENWLCILSEDPESFSFFSNRNSDLSCHVKERAGSLSHCVHLKYKKYNCAVGRFKSDFTDLKILLKGRRPQFLMVLHQ